MTKSPATSSKVSLIASLVMVLVCLLLGGGFVLWYLKAGGETATIKLSADDLAAIQSVNGRGGGNGNSNGAASNAPARRPALAARAPAEPDGIYGTADLPVIHAGSVLVRIQAAAKPGDLPTLVFRQRTWGLLMDAPTFTIARRVVHEPALAKQLAVTSDQLTKLTAIATLPALNAKFVAALPVPADELAKVGQAWSAYSASLAGTDQIAQEKTKIELLALVRVTGNAAMSNAKKAYADADTQIAAILDQNQISAYKLGKSVAP